MAPRYAKHRETLIIADLADLVTEPDLGGRVPLLDYQKKLLGPQNKVAQPTEMIVKGPKIVRLCPIHKRYIQYIQY